MSERHAYLTTAEVADYLRLKERKVYDLVRQGQIPCSRVTGKLLFPRQQIDLWVLNHLEGDQAQRLSVPLVVAGSQDPLLEWAIRESGSDLAMLCQGSGDGVRRLLDGKAMLAGIHLLDATTQRYNEPGALGLSGMRDLLIVHWAKRRQGLLLPADNPLKIAGLGDLKRTDVRVAHRQPDAGAARLLSCLLQQAGVESSTLNWAPHASLSEDDLALSIGQGEADVGLGVEAAAHRQQLGFIPLCEEPFDLIMQRRSYFEPAVQQLMAFAQQARFAERSIQLGGYTIAETGKIVHNA
ncbi:MULTISPECIES: helix-turn-helix transcriptional regulator [Halomonadaceae]|uniref:Helix-turn-helix transcriptional regulator n=2 Tax=Vreelandella TaxID=3137766 RepID=A0A7Z0LPA5_9GAMM|nr:MULTISPECIES: helix-turn-helix transcriptional regulator [Halomonas]AJY51258.1 DNA binding domain protein, excisionase family [Halomonas sp. KO116]NYS76117.1 helix-turn-helix transcriptional regulator [Halomonas glaciei]|tara:strand:+ start:2154 stop:3041 length:888 start_codon:yes stop_codon:yes gene_type:complete